MQSPSLLPQLTETALRIYLTLPVANCEIERAFFQIEEHQIRNQIIFEANETERPGNVH